MKKITLLIVLIGFLAASCNNGYYEQNWRPHAEHKAKKGKNRH